MTLTPLDFHRAEPTELWPWLVKPQDWRGLEQAFCCFAHLHPKLGTVEREQLQALWLSNGGEAAVFEQVKRDLRLLDPSQGAIFLDPPPSLRADFGQFQLILPQYWDFLSLSPLYLPLLLDLGKRFLLLLQWTEEAYWCFEHCHFACERLGLHNEFSAEVYYALGRLAERQELHDVAKADYEKALEHWPTHSYAAWHLAALFRKEEKSQQALALYLGIQAQDPFFQGIYLQLAQTYYELGDHEQAKLQLEILRSINPQDEQAIYWTALLQWKVDQQPDLAKKTIFDLIHHPLQNSRARLLALAGDLYAEEYRLGEEARSYYEKSLEEDLEQPDTLRHFARLLTEQLQDFGLADYWYRRYLAQFPKDKELRLLYAQHLYEYLDDQIGALDQVRLILEQQPNWPLALEFLDEVNPKPEGMDEFLQDLIEEGVELDFEFLEELEEEEEDLPGEAASDADNPPS